MTNDQHQSSPLEIFWRFLTLGLVSFGGPAAHIGYFRKTFVENLGWVSEEKYAGLIALSQFLPGPASSQVGFSIGLYRGGIPGAIAAFIGFTLPSFLIMLFLATSAYLQSSSGLVHQIILALKLLAVVIVADATLSMFNNFCLNSTTKGIAIISAVSLLAFPSLWTQMLVLGIAAGIGMKTLASFSTNTRSNTLPTTAEISNPNSGLLLTSQAKTALVLFFGCLIGPFLLSYLSEWAKLFYHFYISGTLVFGGGHVVLPLLQETVGDAISSDRFLMGYAAAQAIPGPMFTLATFLGAELTEQPFLSALVATIAIFLPGFLLIIAIKDSWERLTTNVLVAGAIKGINAAVVGLLLSALYQPVFTSAVHSSKAMACVLLGFFALRVLKLSIIWLVVGTIFLGLASNLLY